MYYTKYLIRVKRSTDIPSINFLDEHGLGWVGLA